MARNRITDCSSSWSQPSRTNAEVDQSSPAIGGSCSYARPAVVGVEKRDTLSFRFPISHAIRRPTKHHRRRHQPVGSDQLHETIAPDGAREAADTPLSPRETRSTACLSLPPNSGIAWRVITRPPPAGRRRKTLLAPGGAEILMGWVPI